MIISWSLNPQQERVNPPETHIEVLKQNHQVLLDSAYIIHLTYPS